VGWTGLNAASSLIHSSKPHTDEISDTVEIDPQYAQALGFGQGDIVEIGLLYDLPFAKSVGAEPLTADDWEIIEIHASHTESILLSQVRVAKIGQEIDVWILGKTRVRLRIVSLDPFSKNDGLLLTTSTEVVITPKSHEQKTFGKSTSETSRKKSNAKSYGFLLRVLPRRLVPVTVPEDPGPDIVTYVSPRTFAKFCSPKVVDRSITGLLVKLDPPPDPSLSTHAQAPVENDGNVDEQSKDPEGREEKEKGKRVSISRIHGIVDGQILVPLPYENVEEWDLVCLSISPDDVDNASGALLPELSITAPPFVMPNFIASYPLTIFSVGPSHNRHPWQV
jgi:peroxin-1